MSDFRQLLKAFDIYIVATLLLIAPLVSAERLIDQADPASKSSTILPQVNVDGSVSDAMIAGGQFDHQIFNQVLTDIVIATPYTTMVDYARLKKSPDDLGKYLAQLSAVTQEDFNGWSKLEQLAFLINAYNAWTLELIVDDYPRIKSIRELGSFFSSPWQKDFIPLFGATVSLDYIEHTLIRDADRYQDARIHFAVNCASIGCPALRQEAYSAQNLEQQLDQQTAQFLSDKSRNYVDGDRLYLSKIFDWYDEDFARGWNGSQSLSQFLLRYSDALNLNSAQKKLLQQDKLDVEFLSYDWNLNDVQTDFAK